MREKQRSERKIEIDQFWKKSMECRCSPSINIFAIMYVNPYYTWFSITYYFYSKKKKNCCIVPTAIFIFNLLINGGYISFYI